MNEKFNLSLIKNKYSSVFYDRAYKLYQKKYTEIHKNVKDIVINDKQNNKFDISFSSYTLGSGDSIYDQMIDVEFDSTALVGINASCDCKAYDTYGSCKHIISSLFTFFSEISIDKLLKKENIKLDLMIQEYDNLSILLNSLDFKTAGIKDNKTEYKITPYFRIDKNHVYMSLKIGKVEENDYIVKNVWEFFNFFMTDTTYEYGKNLIVKHNIDKFKNKKQLNYILSILNNRSCIVESIASNNHSHIKISNKEVLLFEEEFLYLLEMMSSTIIFKEHNELIEYEIKKLQQKLEFIVEEREKQIKISHKPLITYRVKNNIYIFDNANKNLLVLDCEIEENAILLSKMLKNPIVIDNNNLYNFRYSVMNRLSKIITLDKPLRESKRDINKIISKFELIKDKLNIEHCITQDETLDYPIEKMNKLEYITSEYVDAGDKYSGKYEIIGIENIINYMRYAMPQVIKYSDEIKGNEEFDNFKIEDNFKIDINLTSSGSNLLIDFSTSKFEESELLNVLKALKTNEKYYQLKNKTYVDLEEEQMVKLKDLAQKLYVDFDNLLTTSFKVNSYNTLYLDVLLDDLELKYYKEKKIANMIEQLKDFKNQKLKVSKDIKVKLRDYQQEGVNWLNTLRKYNLNGILGDDMGLGKTLQVIALLSSIKIENPILVVAPASLVYNWESEILKFNPKLKYKTIVGQPDERKDKLQNLTNEILITSYDLLKRDIDIYKSNEYEYIILDEGQNIKNKSSQSAKAIKVLKGEHNLVLTGTPIENKLEELWSIFDFLMPNYLGSHLGFKKQYTNLIKNGMQSASLDLQRKVKPFILRRLKVDVLKELPQKQEKIVYVEMLPQQRKVYDAQALEFKRILNTTSSSEFKKKKIEILAMITKMRQIACNPNLIFENYKGEIIKEEILISNLLDLKATGHKTLVFSQFVSNFKYLEKQFDLNSISYYKIDGSTPKNLRHVLVDRFNEDNTDVFLISLKAGGTGLNIIGADTVIHYDPWWNTAVELQATDRAYRMGQKNNVLVYKYICKDTIEEKILKIQEEKKDLAEDILEGSNISLSKMNKEDILLLFD